MKTMTAILLSLLTLSPLAQASELDERLEQARRKLDEAARELAEIHKQHYATESQSEKAMLGILLGDADDKKGVELYGVTPGGGAEQAGLQAGDLIVSIDSVSLADADEPMSALVEHMKSVEPGEVVVVDYVRDGATNNAAITTQAQAAHIFKFFDKDFNFDFDFDGLDFPDFSHEHGARIAIPGIPSVVTHSRHLMDVSGDLAQYFGVDEGVLVVEAPEDSELAGGDIILSIAGEPVEDAASASKLLGKIDGSASVDVRRSGRSRSVDVAEGEFDRHMAKVIRIERRGDGESEVDVKVIVEDDE